jgi:hypothetical protein
LFQSGDDAGRVFYLLPVKCFWEHQVREVVQLSMQKVGILFGAALVLGAIAYASSNS